MKSLNRAVNRVVIPGITIAVPQPLKEWRHSARRILWFAVVLFLLPQLTDAAQSPFIVAQSDYGGQNGNTGGVTYGSPWAQTFTPDANGTLATIGAGFYTPQPGIEPYYIFQFRDTTPSGAPAASIISSLNVSTAVLTVPPSTGGSYGWVDLTADFSSFGIELSAGHKYAVSIDVPGPAGTTTFNSFFWGTTRTPYAGGEPWILPAGNPPYAVPSAYDFLFTVTANPVPEPTSFTLLALASLAFVVAGRRKGSGCVPQEPRGPIGSKRLSLIVRTNPSA